MERIARSPLNLAGFPRGVLAVGVSVGSFVSDNLRATRSAADGSYHGSADSSLTEPNSTRTPQLSSTMKKTTCTAAVLAGVAVLSPPFALADNESSSAENSAALRKAAAAIVRSVGINTTWAETGVSATGIASSDFLHNDMTKPAAKPLIGQSSAPANVPAAAPARSSDCGRFSE